MKRRLWIKKLHFLVALLSALPLLVLCFTGSLLVYREAIDEYLTREYREVPIQGDRKSITELAEILERSYPDQDFAGVVLPPHAGIAYYYWMKDAFWTVIYIDPYTGQLKGQRSWEDWTLANLIWWATDMHSSFKWGSFGSYVVALSSFILFVSLISGLYLWWPRQRFDRSKFRLRLGKRWKQSAYNLHSVLGMYFSAILALICVTGIAMTFAEPVEAFLHKVTLSPAPAEHPQAKGEAGRSFLTADEILAKANAHVNAVGLEALAQSMNFPTMDNAIVEVSYQGNPSLGGVEHSHVWVHGQSGEIVGTELASEFNRGQSAASWIATVHFGSWGAIAGNWGDQLIRIVWLAAVLLPLFLLLTGLTFVKKSSWKNLFP